MSFIKRNKARIATKQNIIDIAIQEYGSVEAIFKVIDGNPNFNLSIENASLSAHVSELIFADNRTDQEIETVKKFFLEDKVIVNEDNIIIGGAYSSAYSNAYNNFS